MISATTPGSLSSHMRRQPRQRAAVDVAHVVHSGLHAGEVHAAQLLPDLRDGVQSESAQFDLLPRGDIQHAVPDAPRGLRDGAQLRTGGEAIGHADAHHELPRRGLAEEDAHPLEEILLGGTLGDHFGQVVAHAQRIPPLERSQAFDGIAALGHTNRCETEKDSQRRGRDSLAGLVRLLSIVRRDRRGLQLASLDWPHQLFLCARAVRYSGADRNIHRLHSCRPHRDRASSPTR